MLPGVADQLGRLVEAHGLAVQQARAEDLRMVAFHPGRDIDQDREADRVALREAIGAEALDLLEAAFGEGAVVAAAGHALDELVPVGPQPPVGAESRHGAAQTVGLAVGKPGRLDGQPHGLLLKERHAEGLLQNRLQFIRRAMLRRRRRVGHRLGPASSAKVRMDHVALDRTRAHDGDLHHQVVELAGLESGQHRHLRPALHLEDPDGIGLAEHLVDLWIVLRDVGDVSDLRPVLQERQHLEAALERGQHAQRQDVDLHQAQRLDVVLVPLDEGAVLHGGVADGDRFVQPPLGQDIAADVLRQVARKAQQLFGDGGRPADFRRVRIDAGLADMLVGNAVAIAAPDGIGEGGGDILRQAQRLADLADRHARAVVDHGRDDGRAVAAVAAVDILHHLLAPLVLEVDVDVRRLVAVLREKA